MDRTKQHFLQKLYSREIYGSFANGHTVVHDKAVKLFSSIPERLMFYLKDVLQHMGNQIMVGTTRCGQFLITYSYATDLRVPVHMSYKYRLHWWAFRPGAPAYKVAEVQLFDNQDITYALSVGIAQWSRVNDKLIVYGYSDDGDAPYEQEEGDVESRRYYITVTTLPSLHGCQDCKTVAESFDEEDMAANWDSCIGLSCLKHGLTIHTTLDIAPPYPSFDFLTNLKIDNKIIVNTGNFLHVLSFGCDKEEVRPSHDDNIMPADLCHNIGEKLSADMKDYVCPWKKPGSSYSLRSRKTLTRSVNKAWLNTIMDQAEKIYAFEESEDGCEPRFKWYRRRRLADKMYEFCSDDEDMENIRPPTKIPRYLGPTTYFAPKEKSFECKYVTTERLKEESNKDDEGDRWNSSPSKADLERMENIILAEKPKYYIESLRARQLEIENKRRREQLGKQSRENVPSNASCDCDVSNECDNQLSKRLEDDSHTKTAVPQQTLVDNVSCNNDCDSLNKLVVKESYNTPVSSTSNVDPLPSKSDYHKIPPLDVSIINPDLSAILAEWEADSVSSLSPKSDSFMYKNDETNNSYSVIQSFLELIPGITISPRGSNNGARNSDYSWTESENGGSRVSRVNESPHSTSRMSSPNSSMVCKYSPLLVVLRTRNCNQDKDPQKVKEPEERCKAKNLDEGAARGKSVKDADLTMRQRMISGCSVRFDRIYIEVDEEIISTITDIEDDDQGTGFHCALPLAVHGSAYAQLQMISSHKAERMNIHSERVYQTSLDIEQFCFKAADIICKCEGFKFWFCNDYDVEIIDVCAFNGDILGVVCLRVNAEKKPPKNERHNILNQRYFYEVRCVFIWNPNNDRCWLEAYSQLVDVTKHVNSHWAPAKKEAAKLRSALYNSSLFSLRPNPPIRTFTHRMWSSDNILVPSLEEVTDHTNLIGFRLIHVPRRLRRFVEVL